MTEIVFASHNLSKVKEVQHILRTDEIRLVTMGEVGLHDHMIEENGYTYEANAGLKAKTVGDLTSKPTLADDSGLEVEALNWRPGIYSARYAKGSDADRCKKLLKDMEGKTNRNARFVAVYVYYDPINKVRKVFHGEIKGTLLERPRGTGGFGYDPIFQPLDRHESMAELTSEEKNRISHRSMAIKAFYDWWEAEGSVSVSTRSPEESALKSR